MFTLGYQGDLAPIISRIEDAFLADDFALGVVVFAMAVQDYPWTSTKKGALGADGPISVCGCGSKNLVSWGQWTREM
jgi:hypothetical protein